MNHMSQNHQYLQTKSQTEDSQEASPDAVTNATGLIVSSFLQAQGQRANSAELPEIISSVRTALMTTQAPTVITEELKPAVPIKKSVQPDWLICLEDGKRFKSLKRHLQSHYNMTPDEYRVKWGLPADYPMVAPNYALARSDLAKKMGLGQRNKPEPVTPPAPTPKATTKGGSKSKPKATQQTTA